MGIYFCIFIIYIYIYHIYINSNNYIYNVYLYTYTYYATFNGHLESAKKYMEFRLRYWLWVLESSGILPHYEACFVSVMAVRDLTPNTGLFWYMFTEAQLSTCKTPEIDGNSWEMMVLVDFS